MAKRSFEVYDGDGRPPLPIRQVKAIQCFTQGEPGQPGKMDIYLEVTADHVTSINKLRMEETRMSVVHESSGDNLLCADVEILRLPRKVQEGFWPNNKMHEDGHQFVIAVKVVK